MREGLDKIAALFSPMELLALVALGERVMCDTTPPGGRADVVYCFGEMPENTPRVLFKAANLYRRGAVEIIAIPEQSGYGNPPTAELWVRFLCNCFVPAQDIVLVVADVIEDPNTYSESIMLTRDALKNGWETIYIVAEPFHQLRAWMTLQSHLIATGNDSRIRVYNATPNAVDWLEVVTHSNGRTTASRADTIFSEIERIGMYKNILRPTELLDALDQRDRKQ